jgi:exodeoxyribonuclease VII large subunit
MTQEQVLTVTALTQKLKWTLQERFRDVWVSGEISNLTVAGSGHVYFTLNDPQAQLRAVLWKSDAIRAGFDLADGMQVVCRGEIDIYPPRGTYQLVVRQIEPLGQGALQLALKKLHARLEAEGLFDPARKRRLPPFPRCVAVVTSPTGAAIQDFLKVIARRWHGTEVLIIPARVQGEGSAREIAEGVVLAGLLKPAPDILVVTRGGGSAEDLWSFNDETVVRAIAASPIPVISGVGHEIDVTLSDLAADVRALTPSEAAELAVPMKSDVGETVATLSARMRHALHVSVSRSRERLNALVSRRALQVPRDLLAVPARRLDEIAFRFEQSIQRTIDRETSRIKIVAGRLHAISPLSVLARGFSVTQLADGSTVRDIDAVSRGDLIRTRLARGIISSVVQELESPENTDG